MSDVTKAEFELLLSQLKIAFNMLHAYGAAPSIKKMRVMRQVINKAETKLLQDDQK